MKFFMDRNLPQQLARLIEAFDQQCEVRHLDDEFEDTTPDVVWIRALGARDPKPVVICGDGRILRNAAEAQALRESGLTFFHIAEGWVNLRWSEQAWKMIKVWPSIVADAKPRRPTVYRVTVQLKVQRFKYTSELGR
jgi:hypothetical protein